MRIVPIVSFLVLTCGSAASATAQTQGVLHPTQDSFVQDSNPAGNFGVQDLWFGRGSYFGLGNIRTLVQFDLSALPADPQRIRSATFTVYQHSTEPAAGGLPCELHAASAAWNEATVTWNSQPAYDARVWSSADVGDSFYTGPISWDATGLVREHVSGALPNLGWLFRMQYETAGASRLGYFYSSETAPTAAGLPQLSVELYDMGLSAPQLHAGQMETLIASGADPHRRVVFAYSLSGLGSTPVAPLGVSLDLDRAQALASMDAGPLGNAAIRFRVPATAFGRSYWLQACSLGKVSNVASGVVQ